MMPVYFSKRWVKKVILKANPSEESWSIFFLSLNISVFSWVPVGFVIFQMEFKKFYFFSYASERYNPFFMNTGGF